MLIKKGVQGTNYYEDEDIERFRYNPYRIKNREGAEHCYKHNMAFSPLRHLILEPTSRCNLKCRFCNREANLTRPQMHMDMDVYRKVIDEASEIGIHSVSLYALGEPLMHPHIRQMVMYAKGKGIPYVDISTNGTLNMTGLLGTSLNELIISIDGFKKEFEEMRHPAKYEKVMENIENFLICRNGHDYPIIRAQIIEHPMTEPIMKEYIEHWVQKVDVVYVKRMEAMSQNLGDANISREEIDKRLKNRQPCKQLWFGLTVNSDGTYSYCCHDPKGKSVLGNAKDMTMEEAWHKQSEFRNGHFQGEYTELCRECVDFSW